MIIVRRSFGYVLILAIVCGAAVEARVPQPYVYVDRGATGRNNGSTWQDAYTSLQDALANAVGTVTIRVAAGTYKPDRGTGIVRGDREATFQLKNGVTIQGGYAGSSSPKDPNVRDIDLYETILTGDLTGNDIPVSAPEQLEQESALSRADNSYHVVTGSDTDATAVLDGLTITGGNAGGGPRWQYRTGGGIINHYGSPTIISCTIRENYGRGSGGIYNSHGNYLITDCVFVANYAITSGGAIGNDFTSLVMTGCEFSDNAVQMEGGAVYGIFESEFEMTGCVFNRNRAGHGGAICNTRGNLSLANCIFSENEARSLGGAIVQGIEGDFTMTNCILAHNRADEGGAVWAGTTPTLITNSTFVDNFAQRINAIFCHSNSHLPGPDLELVNCILWNDGDEIDKFPEECSIRVVYSCIAGGWPGEGNHYTYPAFKDPGSGDYGLSPESPCTDAGLNSAVPASITTDINGLPRIANGVVDMGACEVPGPRVIYVDAGAGRNQDGSSWTNAFGSLQDALAAAAAGEEPVHIRLAAGVYRPDIGTAVVRGDRDASFVLAEDMVLMGGYAGSNEPNNPGRRNPGVFETILSGDLLGNDTEVNMQAEFLKDPNRSDNSYHVVRCHDAESGVRIDGLTIASGNAAGPDCSFAYSGAGLLSSQSKIALTSVTVRNCSAKGDYAWGGGIYAVGNTTMTDCLIENNIAYGGEGGAGGGVYCYDRARLDSCLFAANLSRTGGGFNSAATINLTDCRFVANAAMLLGPGTISTDISGGGAYVSEGWGGSSITRCVFLENTAASGGGLCTYEAEPVITNCLFAGNSATEYGGGMRCDTYPCDVRLSNCTFADNTAGQYGGALFAGYEAKPHLINCVLWGNSAPLGSQIATRGDSLVKIDYTDVQGGADGTASANEPADPEDEPSIDWGQRNIDADPCFADSDNRDYHLQSQQGRYWPEHDVWVLDGRTSPAIDAGYPSTDPLIEPMPNGGRINLGAYGATAKASRSNKPPLVGDLNGDGIVDFRDMDLMGSNWLLEEDSIPPIDD